MQLSAEASGENVWALVRRSNGKAYEYSVGRWNRTAKRIVAISEHSALQSTSDVIMGPAAAGRAPSILVRDAAENWSLWMPGSRPFLNLVVENNFFWLSRRVKVSGLDPSHDRWRPPADFAFGRNKNDGNSSSFELPPDLFSDPGPIRIVAYADPGPDEKKPRYVAAAVVEPLPATVRAARLTLIPLAALVLVSSAVASHRAIKRRRRRSNSTCE